MTSQDMAGQRADKHDADKVTLRRRLRDARRELSPSRQSDAAAGLMQQLQSLPVFNDSMRIALYLPNDGEIDPSAIIRWCEVNQRHSYLPVVQQQQGRNWLLFGEVTGQTRFTENRFGIAEPEVDQDKLLSARDLDLVLLPLVGFDGAGNRIGMGGGFYDTTFEFLKGSETVKPQLVGLAHEIQKVPYINAESWDVPLAMVVTDSNVYQMGSGQSNSGVSVQS